MNEDNISDNSKEELSMTSTTAQEDAEGTSSNENNSAEAKGPGSFRRAKSRAARACEICHARKVRCDVTVRMPCTNCAAFGCECRIPEVRQRKGNRIGAKKAKKIVRPAEAKPSDKVSAQSAMPTMKDDAIPKKNMALDPKEDWKRVLDTRLSHPGRMSFMGSTSHLNLILENMPDTESYYYSTVGENSGGSRIQQMDREEIEILKIKGAFLMPAQELCDDIVECYFERIHPLIPMINRTQFMRQYNDPANPPSLLLRQAILVAGSRACTNPGLLDERGSSKLATATFYKRAKALFDANYEVDRVAAVQSAILMGWWLEGPDEVTSNVYYWTRVGVTVGQGIGLHRSVEKSGMPEMEKRVWKRIWWSLFVRDRSTAVAMGRPVMINLEDSDVPMITMDDFNEDEPNQPSPYPVNRVHALYFIASVKLSEIMGLTIKEQYSVGAENSRCQNKVPDVSQCDMAMAAWMNNLPSELKYSLKDRRNHDFFKAILHAQYYTVLCLVHRSNILHKGPTGGRVPSYPSWGIAFQAAHMIVRIMENLQAFNELQLCPASMVYTVFSAMIILIYQTESPSKSVVESAQRAVGSCRSLLEVMGQTWDTADRICKLARFLNADPKIREKIVRSAKRYAASGDASPAGTPAPAAPNGRLPMRRPYVEQDMNPHKMTNASQQSVSYVRQANPQLSSQEVEHQMLGQHQQQQDYNRSEMQQPQPQLAFSPELFLVTNTSPSSVSFFENFQPSQLFPDSSRTTSQGQTSSPDVTSDKGGAIPDMLLAGQESFGDMFLEAYNSSPEESVSAPNTLNLGDWYKFLATSTTAGQYADVPGLSVKTETSGT
jgi:hypothetical protein